MNYVCSECSRPIGLMADARGGATLYKCWRTGRIAQPQYPVKRNTPRLPVIVVPQPISVPRWVGESDDSRYEF